MLLNGMLKIRMASELIEADLCIRKDVSSTAFRYSLLVQLKHDYAGLTSEFMGNGGSDAAVISQLGRVIDRAANCEARTAKTYSTNENSRAVRNVASPVHAPIDKRPKR